MLCAPRSLNTDKYADIRRRGVVNATIMHNTFKTLNKYAVRELILLFFIPQRVKDKQLIESFRAD